MRPYAFTCALVLVFLRFSYLPETFTYFTGINTYVLYIFGLLALIGVVAFGGLKRTFRYTPGRLWLAFLVCMVLAVPLSSWRGGSFLLAETYLRTDFIMLLVTAGLAASWVECRCLMYAIALAAVVNLATTRLLMLQTIESDRLFLQSKGMISDPNDLAAHLLLVLPFLLFVILRKRTHLALRLILVAAMTYGMFLILRTGSRGGLVAFVFTLGFVLMFSPTRQKVAIAITASVIFVFLVSLLPGPTRDRLKSFSEGQETSTVAIESAESRKYLLKKSVELTLKKPFFGVGPGQFQNYEGREAIAEHRQGNWHATHNTYTQISSECGIPALIFFLAAIVSTFGTLRKIRKKAQIMKSNEIVTAASCITVGLTGYAAASLFLANGYRFQFLAISGLVIAIWRIVSKTQTGPHADSTSAERPHEAPEFNTLGVEGKQG
jgi:O-antigen ligase